jgi:hypothetical protein
MPSFLLRPKVTLFAAALVVPALANGACNSRTACLAYSQPEYAANNNSCLSQSDALATFTSPGCPGSIASVDGPGTFDGEICCYPVTYAPVDQSCDQTDTGFGGSSPFPPGTTTFDPTTTTEFCPPTCAEALQTGNFPCGAESSLEAYVNLLTCAGCMGTPPDGGVDCSSRCFSLCAEGPVDLDCDSCLTNECASFLTTCDEN